MTPPQNGEYGYHDWKADPVAEGIFALSPRFGPVVQTGLRDRREGVQPSPAQKGVQVAG